MHNYRLLTILLLAVCCHAAAAANCDGYVGAPATTAKEGAAAIGSAIAAVKSKNARALFAQSDQKIILVRRSVSSGLGSRSGNMRLTLRASDIDPKLNIHIGEVKLSDFAGPAAFNAVKFDKAMVVRRDVCEDAGSCDDRIPASEEVPYVLKDLLQCNPNNGGVFVLDDGIFVIDMQLAPNAMPVGRALLFSRIGSGYRLASMIIQF